MVALQSARSALACIAIALMLVIEPSAEAIGCGQVVNLLSPCLRYIRARGPLGSSCCRGIRVLNRSARSRGARQGVCRCLKSLTGVFPGVNYRRVGGMPRRCGVRIPYRISPTTNCARYAA